MPFSGTGSFTLVAGNPVVTGTNISSVAFNNTMSDFANGFTNCVTRDGQSPPTSNLPMGSQRHTGASSATGAGEYLVYGQALPATTIASLAVTGAAALNGAVAIGDAAGDALTINPNAITLANTPAITGAATWASAQTFNGAVTINGATVISLTETSFTPAVTFGGAATGVTYNANRGGTYIRLGGWCFFLLRLRLSAKGSSTGTALITGMPFAMRTSGGLVQVPLSISATSMTGLTGALVAEVAGSSLVISQWGATGCAAITDAAFSNSSDIFVSGFYPV